MQEEFKANGEKVPWTCIMRDLLYCQESNFGPELEVYEEEIQKERKEQNYRKMENMDSLVENDIKNFEEKGNDREHYS